MNVAVYSNATHYIVKEMMSACLSYGLQHMLGAVSNLYVKNNYTKNKYKTSLNFSDGD